MLCPGDGPGRTTPPEERADVRPALHPPPRRAEPTLIPVPEPSELALAYARGGDLLWIASALWGLLVPAAFLFTGLSARIRARAARVTSRRGLLIALYFVAFSGLTFVLDLPLAYYQDFVREHLYGLSSQTEAKWITDMLLALLVNTAIGALFLWVPYALLARSPRRWWLYTGLLALPFLFLLTMIAPVWLAPLFNRSGPMKDPALEARIQALAARCGVEGGRVFVLETSVDSNRLNAAVVGFGATKRIWVTDTLLAKLDTDEVLFAVGHELGHYVLGHVPRTLVTLALLAAATLFAAGRAAEALIRRYSGRFGFTELSDVASLPLLMLLANVLSLAAGPAFFTVSRAHEREADRFGLELTRLNQAAATGFVKLQKENLKIPRPGPVFTVFRASHPSLGERIDFANRYAPWATGEPSRYERYFRASTAAIESFQ